MGSPAEDTAGHLEGVRSSPHPLGMSEEVANERSARLSAGSVCFCSLCSPGVDSSLPEEDHLEEGRLGCSNPEHSLTAKTEKENGTTTSKLGRKVVDRACS